MSDYLIRDAASADAARIAEIYAYYVQNTAISFAYTVPSADQMAQKIAGVQAEYPFLVIESNGIVMGYAYAGVFNEREAYSHCCEVSIYLDHTSTRNGMGKALYAALEGQLFAMGIRNLYACIGYPENEDEYLTRNSAEFHSHMGYRLVGKFYHCGLKFGRYYNMVWMEKLLQ